MSAPNVPLLEEPAFVSRALWGYPIWQVETWTRLETPFSHGFFGKNPNIKHLQCASPNLSRCLRILRLNQVHENHWIEILGNHSCTDSLPAFPKDFLTIAPDIVLEETHLAADGWIAHLEVLQRHNLALGIATADCIPVLGFCPDKMLVFALHCGWRSALSELLVRVLARVAELGANPTAMELAIGPGARIECYQVGPEIRNLTLEAIGKAAKSSISSLEIDHSVILQDSSTPNGTVHYVSIPQLLKLQACSSGVPVAKIAVLDKCTICDESFSSHRREGNAAGRQLSFIG